jgi:hypothetical protein
MAGWQIFENGKELCDYRRAPFKLQRASNFVDGTGYQEPPQSTIDIETFSAEKSNSQLSLLNGY